MALTNTEKQRVIRYIGLPARTLDKTSLYYSSWVDEKLNSPGLSAEDEVEVKTFISRIEEIDLQLRESITRLKVTSVGAEINLNQREMGQLRSEKRRVVRELQDYLDLYEGGTRYHE